MAAFILLFDRHPDFLNQALYQTGWNHWIAELAVVCAATGFGVAIWARIILGRFWSGNITFKEGHRVIDRGPYRWVRHPIYSGWLLAALGTALAAGIFNAMAALAIIYIAFAIKAKREEKMLLAELGNEYFEYRDRVPWAIVPGIASAAATRQ